MLFKVGSPKFTVAALLASPLSTPTSIQYKIYSANCLYEELLLAVWLSKSFYTVDIGDWAGNKKSLTGCPAKLGSRGI